MLTASPSPKQSTGKKGLVQVNVSTQPRRKGKRTKPVIYQIFEDASRETQDKYWSNRLQDAARGIFPKKFSCSRGMLVFCTNRKSDSIAIPTNPKDAFKVFYDFTRHYGGLASENDIQATKLDLIANNRANVRQLNNKDLWPLLQQFIVNYSAYYKMENAEKKSLKSAVCLGYHMGIFDCKTVIIQNGIIVNIPGLVHDMNNRYCYIEKTLFESAHARMAKEFNSEKHVDPMMIKHEMAKSRGKSLNDDWKKIAAALDAVGPRPGEGDYSDIF